MQKTVAGPFTIRNMGGGAWAAAGADGVEVMLRGAGAAAPEVLTASGVESLSLEWTMDAVRLTVRGRHGAVDLSARSALVHEALPRLYDTLPLAGFDAAAQRFWRRIFTLLRVPGGRFLLRYIARRGNRGRAVKT